MAYTREKNREYQREYYSRHKERYLRKAKISKKKQRAELRKMIDDAKSVPCADCGVSYPSYVMQFDHISEKNFNISTAVSGISKQKLLHEISLCQVVCSNCHAGRTYKRRISKSEFAV